MLANSQLHSSRRALEVFFMLVPYWPCTKSTHRRCTSTCCQRHCGGDAAWKVDTVLVLLLNNRVAWSKSEGTLDVSFCRRSDKQTANPLEWIVSAENFRHFKWQRDRSLTEQVIWALCGCSARSVKKSVKEWPSKTDPLFQDENEAVGPFYRSWERHIQENKCWQMSNNVSGWYSSCWAL